MTQTQGLGNKDYLLWTERTLCPFLLPSMPETNPEDGMDLALCWRKPRGREVPPTLSEGSIAHSFKRHPVCYTHKRHPVCYTPHTTSISMRSSDRLWNLTAHDVSHILNAERYPACCTFLPLARYLLVYDSMKRTSGRHNTTGPSQRQASRHEEQHPLVEP